MPLLLVEHTFGQRVEARTCRYGDIGDDETLVVQGKVAVNGLGQDAVLVIDEED